MKILSSIVLVVKNLQVKLPYDCCFKERSCIEEVMVGGERDCPVLGAVGIKVEWSRALHGYVCPILCSPSAWSSLFDIEWGSYWNKLLVCKDNIVLSPSVESLALDLQLRGCTSAFELPVNVAKKLEKNTIDQARKSSKFEEPFFERMALKSFLLPFSVLKDKCTRLMA